MTCANTIACAVWSCEKPLVYFSTNFWNVFFPSARNKSIDADAQWLSNTSAKVIWRGQYGENVHLSVRRIIYLHNGTVIPSKWFRANITSSTMELYGDIPKGVMFKSGTSTQVTSVVSFTQVANYEVYLSKISSTGDVSESVSIFLDASDVLVLGM